MKTMRPILYTVLALILYSLTSVAVEQKLAKFSTFTLVLLFTLPFIPLSLLFLGAQKAGGQAIAFPAGTFLWIVFGLGAIYFLADYFYLGAFTGGGDAVTIATIIVLAPVTTGIIKYLWVGGYPTVYRVLAYALAAASVLLVTIGQK